MARATNRFPDEGGFFGRAADLEVVADRLSHPGALVTIVGPPGVGKSRLANELVRSVGAIDYLTCDASELHTGEAMLARLAELFLVGPGSAPIIERVGDVLADHGDLVLVFDNAEQLIDSAAPALRTLRQAAPNVRWLVTSREPLGLIGEWRHDLKPLATEAGPTGEAAAVAMLADRVTHARGEAPAASEREVLVRIAARLEGLPLALELAASRIAAIGATEVEARLEQQLDVLTRGPRDLDRRQQTLRQAIAWSWDLLRPIDRRALAELSAFRGGFDLAAAEAVIEVPGEATLDVVQQMRQKSLLHTRVDDAGNVRFGMYLSIREFAAGELASDGVGAVYSRHASYYADLVARLVRAERLDLSTLLVERDNILVAIERCIAGASAESIPIAARLLLGLVPLIDRSPLEPYLERLEAFLATPAAALLSPDLRCGIMATAARCMRRLGRLDNSKRLYADALELANAIDSKVHQARLHAEIGMVAFFESRIAEALARWRTSMAMSRELGDDRMLGLDQTRCGMILRESNRLFEARTILAEALATHHRTRDDDAVVITLAELAMIHLELDELEDGKRLLDEATRRQGAERNLLGEGAVLARRAFWSWARGDYELGTALAQRALVDFAQIGYRRLEAGLVTYMSIAQLLADPTSAVRESLEWARALMATDPRGNYLCGIWLGYAAICDRDLALAADRFAGLPSLGDEEPQVIAGAILRLPLEVHDPTRLARAAAELADTRLAATDRPARASSLDVRLALRAVGQLDRRPSEPRIVTTPPSPTLVIRADGSEFTFEGNHQPLGRYRTLRRLLLELVDKRLAAPGVPLAWDALFAVGWKGEHIHFEAAKNRVKVAISSLRTMGLRDAIIHNGIGYLIDPQLEVRVVTR